MDSTLKVPVWLKGNFCGVFVSPMTARKKYPIRCFTLVIGDLVYKRPGRRHRDFIAT